MAATTNPSLTAAWAVLVAAGDSFFLSLPFTTRCDVEVATTDSEETAPTVTGHALSGDKHEGITRDLIGPGVVWAKARDGSVAVVVNAWTPSA